MSSVAARITQVNLIYTITDFLGNGHQKSLSWKLDEEIDVDHPNLGLKGTQITTKGGLGEYLITFKDHTGKISTWECVVCEKFLNYKVSFKSICRRNTSTYLKRSIPCRTI
jgi:hypothetical protein